MMNGLYLLLPKRKKETIMQSWIGQLKVIDSSDDSYELEIQSRGSLFHVITGSRSWGDYICIPNHDVGSESASLADVFWNRERLSRLINPIDAATVAYGLAELSKIGGAL